VNAPNATVRRAGRRTILITDSDLGPPDIEREVCSMAGFELVEARCRSEGEVLRAIEEVAPCGLLVQYAPITAAIMGQAPSLRAIARYGTGLDSIDVEAASRAGVVVVNVLDYAIQEVADHTLTLALMLARQLPRWSAATRRGAWPAPEPSPSPLRTLDTMTFGLTGFGRIGRAVAGRVRAFGATVIAHDPFLLSAVVENAGVQPVDWDELWARADIVSLHTPLTRETEHLVDARAFARMRPGSYLINTARAGLVDRSALEGALLAGTLAGVAVDVWWQEPPDPQDPLLRDPRMLVTPHVGYLSADSVPQLRRSAAERLIAQVSEPDPVS
jgi:D-3-phosphoglycerate dehydrogenase / 2-oxoglutarate reductase